MCTAFGPLSGRGWLWSTVHVVGLFLFNDSYFGPYSCLSFNAKQKLLFRSNCCCGTNSSRHQFCRWISQLCILQSEVPSLGYFWHLAVMVLIPASSATSAILLAHAQLGNKAGELPFSFFFHACSEYSILLPDPAFRPLHAAAAWSRLFSALSIHWRDPASWPVPGCCQLCYVLLLYRVFF